MTRFKSNDDVAAVVIMPAFHEVAAALERLFAQRAVQEVVAIDGSTENTRAALQSVAACDLHLKTLARAELGQRRTRANRPFQILCAICGHLGCRFGVWPRNRAAVQGDGLLQNRGGERVTTLAEDVPPLTLPDIRREEVS